MLIRRRLSTCDVYSHHSVQLAPGAILCTPYKHYHLASPASDFLMENSWPAAHQQDNVCYSTHHRGSRDMPCSLSSFVPQVQSTPSGPIPAGQWEYIPDPETDAAQGCPCSICSRASYGHQMARQVIEHQDPRVPVVRTVHSTAVLLSSDRASLRRNEPSHMQIKTSVVPTQAASLPLWVACRHGLLLRKFRCLTTT